MARGNGKEGGVKGWEKREGNESEGEEKGVAPKFTYSPFCLCH